MPLLKKFGRTVASHSERWVKPDPRHTDRLGQQTTVSDLLGQNPDALLGQWASILDKIIKKPVGRQRPTKAVWKARDAVGQALWRELESGPFSGMSPKTDEYKRLHQLWQRRIHPYGKTTIDSETIPKGRLYWQFLGNHNGPLNADQARNLARLIHERLMGPLATDNRGRPVQGIVPRRIASISGNVLAKLRTRENTELSESVFNAGIQAYSAPGDVAKEIHAAISQIEIENESAFKIWKTDGSKAPRPVPAFIGWPVAAKILYDHYAKIFTSGENVLPIKDAETIFPDAFKIHSAIKEYYRHCLKRHKKSPTLHQSKVGHIRQISEILPHEVNGIFRHLQNRQENRNINSLIRLGRIIHYSQADEETGDISTSHYWTSDGQTKIKQREAFVRVWREVISQANRTLADWLHPDGETKDVTTGSIDFDSDAVSSPQQRASRSRLLYGSYAATLESDQDHRALIQLVRSTLTNLRNSSFHFKGLVKFQQAFTEESTGGAFRAESARSLRFARELLNGDWSGKSGRLRQTLLAAHVEKFLQQHQLNTVWPLCQSGEDDGQLPLPRFSRLVKRVENTGCRTSLPRSVNRRRMKNAAIHCRYILTRLIYEGNFRLWLGGRSAATINQWIEAAERRADTAVKKLHPGSDGNARMSGTVRLRPEQTFSSFLSELTALTAREFRVQIGYNPDRRAAREQARWLEDLHCDVLGLAFEDYIREQRLGWLAELFNGENLQENGTCLVNDLADPGEIPNFLDWECRLYALLHLVPVDSVGRLLHQIRRWDDQGTGNAETTGQNQADGRPSLARSLQRLLGLYLDMHDAKFQGGEPLPDHPEIAGLFETPDLAARIFPTHSTNDDGRLPIRALREMLRFGTFGPLNHVFAEHRITADAVSELLQLETEGPRGVDAQQVQREDFHASLCQIEALTSKAQPHLKAYRACTSEIVRHRDLNNHVRLINHVRTGQLMMSILARLADMAGTFERDIFFAILTFLHNNDLTPADVFKDKGVEAFENFQILEAMNCTHHPQNRPEGDRLKAFIENHFSLASGREYRKRFAHFNMLRRSDRSSLNLTAEMNTARTLMAYDRKLKNAVSSAISRLLDREQLVCSWTMGGDHQLKDARIGTRSIRHFNAAALSENLRDEKFLQMVAKLFAGSAISPPSDLTNKSWSEQEIVKFCKNGDARAERSQANTKR